MILFFLMSIIPVTSLIFAIYNYFTAPRLVTGKTNDNNSLVSVLIPARDEEENIGECLKLLSKQSYKNIEILVLDDFSGDNTYQVSVLVSELDNRIKVIKGRELPENWLGKNWACRQLADIASGDFLLFIDADVSIKTNAVESSVNAMINTKTDMLSVFPYQQTMSAGEKIIVPILTWFFISFFLPEKIFNSKNKNFAAANGQFMLWRRNVYIESGGHTAVKDKIVEDIELAKYLKSKGYKIILLLSDKLISCRMYKGFKEAVLGFTKNAYPSSSMPGWKYCLILFFFSFTYLFPLIMMFQNELYIYLLAVIIVQRILVSIICHQNILMNIFLYPVQMVMLFYIGMNSYLSFRSGNLYWKKRKL